MAGSGAVDTSFDEAYRSQAPGLIRVAFLLTGSNAAAEDAVHSVFVRAADRLATLDHPASYLRASVVNECRTQHRRSARLVYDRDNPATEPFPDEVIETLDALGRLGDRPRR